MKVRTGAGEIECPEGPYAERTKYWALALRDVVRVEELYALIAALQKESYEVGVLTGVANLIGGFGNALTSVVDVDAEVVGDEGELASVARGPALPPEESNSVGVPEEASNGGADFPEPGGKAPSGSFSAGPASDGSSSGSA